MNINLIKAHYVALKTLSDSLSCRFCGGKKPKTLNHSLCVQYLSPSSPMFSRYIIKSQDTIDHNESVISLDQTKNSKTIK